MEPLGESIRALWATGQYTIPLVTSIGLVAVAIAIKAALYPFHSWLPSAHASATSTSSSILSGLVLKGYIVLLTSQFTEYLLLRLCRRHTWQMFFSCLVFSE